MNNKIIIAIISVASFSLSVNAQRFSREQYVDKYKNIAIDEMNKTGIPASIILAQGILESDCGNSYLATDGNNHFGIKCHNWQGDTIHHDDDKNQECFRKYKTVSESYSDHSAFLVGQSRYKTLFSLDKTDYKGWATGLKNSGYATDPNYDQRLINIIDDMSLYQYDADCEIVDNETSINTDAVISEQSSEITESYTPIKYDADFIINPLHEHSVKYNNGVKYIEVASGDSFDKIANEFHLLTSELLAFNDLSNNANILSIKYLYIKAKRNRAHPDCVTHIVKNGDSLWAISHIYGVKLKKIMKFNNIINANEKLNVGDVIYLRNKK